MKLTIYHGSKNIIEKPIYGVGKRHNDYGLGFYCTQEEEIAKEWAVGKDWCGYSNQYTLDTDGLNILNLNQKRYNVLHWITILLKNRDFDITSVLAKNAKTYLLKNFSINIDNVDIIIGYRADDSYFSFAQDFLNGTISLRQLNNAMKLGKLGLQIVLISEKAFEKIKFNNAESINNKVYYPKKQVRDIYARSEYLNNERFNINRDDIFIQDILKEEIKENDPRLQ